MSELRRTFDSWAESVQTKYAHKQWLLSKWDGLESINWSTEKQQIMLNTIITGLSLRSSDVLLDAGCGGGWVLNALKPRVREFFGVDFSMGMLANAKVFFSQSSLICAELAHLPLKSASIDCLLNYYVLMNWTDDRYIEEALTEMVRVVKTDGRILIGQLPDETGSQRYEQAKKEYGEYCLKTYGKAPEYAPDHKPPLRLFKKEWWNRVLKRSDVRFSFQDSFNPFFREGEPAQVNWRFDVLIEKIGR